MARLYIGDSFKNALRAESTAELVKAAQAGGKSAFAEFVRRYERAAMVTAFSVLGDFH